MRPLMELEKPSNWGLKARYYSHWQTHKPTDCKKNLVVIKDLVLG